MSIPSREQAIAEAKADGWKYSHEDNEYYPPVNKKKKSMAKKMSSVNKLKKLVRESENLRRFPFDMKRFHGNGNLPPGHHDRDNE